MVRCSGAGREPRRDHRARRHRPLIGVIDNPPGAAAEAIVARLPSVSIRGSVAGAPNPLFQGGLVAQQIGSFTLGAPKFVLTPGAANDTTLLFIGIFGDLRVREVAI